MKRYAVFLSLFFPCVAFSQSSVDDKQPDLLGQGRVQVGVSVGGFPTSAADREVLVSTTGLSEKLLHSYYQLTGQN